MSELRLLKGTEGGRRLSFLENQALHGELIVPRPKDAEHFAPAMLEQIQLSGLTGRGGGGFPTATKLRTVAGQRRRTHLAINVMEGEPAAQKDTVLACFAPHLILDGAEILAAVIGASAVSVCVARDNRAAFDSLSAALSERPARRGGVNFELEVLPARYIGGEESALVHWLDGGLAMPTFRPTKPGKLMIRNRQTVVDNAETAASIALIARHGGAWFAQSGLGSCLVTISGAVRDPGVFEVALGASLAEVIAQARPVGRVTGILLGGYGGTFVGPDAVTALYSREGLRPFGASPGAGVIVVFDESTCGITETARIARWMANESAGQCGPCIFGLPAVADDLENLATARGDGRTEAQLRRRLETIAGRGACAHPDGVIRMVRSALAVFSADLASHTASRGCAYNSKASLLTLPANRGELEWR